MAGEPAVVDSGRNWLTLSWPKSEVRGGAPVVAYRVEAWPLGGEGGARWIEVRVKTYQCVLRVVPVVRNVDIWIMARRYGCLAFLNRSNIIAYFMYCQVCQCTARCVSPENRIVIRVCQSREYV